jgi:lysophospholipase L1-like esterase
MFRPWRSAALPLAATLLLGAACGGDDSSAPPTDAPADSVSDVGALPTAPAQTGGPRRIVIIGDSISFGTQEEYPLAMPDDDIELNAVPGIRLGPQREAITAAVAERPDVLVIELGTNDVPVFEPAFLDEIDEVLDETADLPCVLWVNTFVSKFATNAAEVNDHLDEAAADHDNLQIVDWFTLANDDRGLLSPDGLHPNEDGQQVLALAVAASAAHCNDDA